MAADSSNPGAAQLPVHAADLSNRCTLRRAGGLDSDPCAATGLPTGVPHRLGSGVDHVAMPSIVETRKGT